MPLDQHAPPPPPGANGPPADVQQQQPQDPNIAIPIDNFIEFVRQMRNENDIMRDEARQQQHQNRVAHQLKDNRQRAEAIAKIKVPHCDGTQPKALREWLRAIQLTIPYSQLTTYIASLTATDGLLVELEHFLSEQPDRNRVTWPELKAHLEQAFLSPYEDDRLRDEVDKLKQGQYETSASYARRFRELAAQAYPGEADFRNEDQQRILLRAYMRGLKDRSMKERLATEGRPKTVEQAMRLVTAYEADNYVLKVALEDGATMRHEEPMDISAMSANNNQSTGQHSNQPSAMAKDMADMRRQVSGLTQQFTKLMSALETKQGPSANRPRQQQQSQYKSQSYRQAPTQPNNFKYTPEGAPICEFCGIIGHIQRLCRKRQRAQHNRGPQMNSQSQQRNNQGGH